ncbi:GntR family transcriptional regulator [Pararoseomonas indoligenes]|uniref:GntR family transcriptional regulator n=1 Tax=Roseomonas indoligenes TaxID=2820811 RepID=A0A940MXC6_9PROT|nr:GntR family transcriptional regulator [Pararoseomonas indoligenes]MBP0495993.1 GntR family transcriptional regulator [Pararoseomonas indoligenes]
MRRPDARPLYVQVEAILNDRIVSGSWKSGQAIPAEPELAAELGVSAGTLRRALARLEQRHLIERRQGRGTYVAQQTSQQALGQFFRVRNLAGRPVDPETVITAVTTSPASEEEARRLRLAPGEEVHRIDRSRVFEGEPRIAERISLPAAFFPNLTLPLAPKQLGTEIYVHYRNAHGIIVVQAEENLSATAATEADAAILGCPVGTPLLLIERVTFDAAGRPVELRVSRLDTRAHRYAVEIA